MSLGLTPCMRGYKGVRGIFRPLKTHSEKAWLLTDRYDSVRFWETAF